VTWEVLLHEEFEPEFDVLPEDLQDELLAHAKLLQQFGPQLGRPRADTLNGSRHANMKELAGAKNAFTANSSKRRMFALTRT